MSAPKLTEYRLAGILEALRCCLNSHDMAEGMGDVSDAGARRMESALRWAEYVEGQCPEGVNKYWLPAGRERGGSR